MQIALQAKKQLDHDFELANEIIRMYFQHSPQQLSAIVLHSQLSKYSEETALELIEEIQQKFKLNTPKDKIARAMLNSKVGRWNKAALEFMSTDSDLLVDYFCQSTTSLFMIIPQSSFWFFCDLFLILFCFLDKGEYGKVIELLRVSDPWATLEILVELQKSIELPRAMEFLRSSPKFQDLPLKYNAEDRSHFSSFSSFTTAMETEILIF
jgi:hypothetical protein